MVKRAEKRWKFYAVYAVYKLRNIFIVRKANPTHCASIVLFKEILRIVIIFC